MNFYLALAWLALGLWNSFHGQTDIAFFCYIVCNIWLAAHEVLRAIRRRP